MVHSLTLPWSIGIEEERRFQRILISVIGLSMLAGVIVPWLPTFKPAIEQTPEAPPRVAKLLFEKRVVPPPEPKPVVKPKPEPKPIVKKAEPKQQPVVKQPPKPKPRPVPKVDQTQLAREKAAKSGLLAMQDALADLRTQSVKATSQATRLSNAGSQAKQVERALVTSKVSTSSNGINTAALSQDAGSTQLAARTATQAVAPVIPQSTTTQRKGDRVVAGRSIEEIQIVFDQNKSAIYSLYNRELRKDPTLQGKFVLKLTIDPSGKVSAIQLVSSELGMPSLEQKLLHRIKMFSFGAKNVDAVTITYPIDFLPV